MLELRDLKNFASNLIFIQSEAAKRRGNEEEKEQTSKERNKERENEGNKLNEETKKRGTKYTKNIKSVK